MDIESGIMKAKEILEKSSESSKEQAMDFIKEAGEAINKNMTSEEFKKSTIEKVDKFFEMFDEQISSVVEDKDKLDEIKKTLIDTIIVSKENGFEIDIMDSLTSLIKVIGAEF